MTLHGQLVELLGADRVLSEPVELHVFSKDASITRGRPDLVVFPEDAPEVASIVKLAAAAGAPIVPRGAGTGLTAGASPMTGGVVVVTTRLKGIHINPADRTAWVGAGVVNLDLTRAAGPFGLQFAPDPSSQAACTVGGNVANNSGGPHCLAEGSTTSHVLGVEVVTASGEILILGGAAPDPIGLDLRAVVVGSEGTMVLVTRVLVRLIPTPPAVRTQMIQFDDIERASACVSSIIAAGLVPAAIEMMDQQMIRAVENWLKAGLPTEATAILLVELTGEAEAVEAEAQLVTEVARSHGATEVTTATTPEDREIMWRARKSAFGAVAQLATDYYLHDTVVPRTRLVEAMSGVYEIAERHGLTMANVFHAGDGNLHPLIAFNSGQPGVLEKVMRAGDEIVELCLSLGGALSGEHGIGVEKRDLMHRSFSAFDLDAQARLKGAFDPVGLFNPAKILPQGARCFDFGGQPRQLPEGSWV